MKHTKLSEAERQKLAEGSQLSASNELNRRKNDFAPARAEVAERAYFNYVNQGSLPGHDSQHWLDAETELIAERYLGRVNEFRNNA